MGASAPASVKRLVDLFDRDRKAFLSADYKEEQLRDAAFGRQLTAYSLRPSNSKPSAVSRRPMANSDGQVYEQFRGVTKCLEE